MHSMAASAAIRAALPGRMRGIASVRVRDGAKAPLASRHFSKNGAMSAVRSLMAGRFSSGPISSLPLPATLATWVR
jgi:hypothetical protein